MEENLNKKEEEIASSSYPIIKAKKRGSAVIF